MILPKPSQQIEFATLLDGAREVVLAEALHEAVRSLSVRQIDIQLARYAEDSTLTKLAAFGLRGEAIFPVPLLLEARPSLIGYYRLVYGYSQKEFYAASTGCSLFKTMEVKGLLSANAASALDGLCRAFGEAGALLVAGLGKRARRNGLLHELSLLTLGAQFRGSANNKRGTAGIKAVFETVRLVVADGIASSGDAVIEIRNAARKRVTIEIAADPDIYIYSHLENGDRRPIVAIEVKAGEDHSNIWNRIGEAEKSHLKARAKGVTECWTIVNDPKMTGPDLKTRSPSTDRVYQLLELSNPDSAQFSEFAMLVRDMVGL